MPEATTPTVTTPVALEKKMTLPSPSEATTPTLATAPDDVAVAATNENRSQDDDTSPPPPLVASRIQAAAIPMVNYSGRILDPHAASVIAQWHARWPKVR